MLIELKITKDPALHSDEERCAIENAGLLAAFGYHFVTGERNSLIAAVQQNMSNRASAALRKALSSFATHRGIASHVKRRLVLADDAVSVSFSQGAWTIPLKLFGDPKLLREGMLLAENSEDALFYRGLAKVFQAKHMSSTLPIKLEVRGGGGSTVAAELRLLLMDAPRLFLCIVDSDREWSGGGLGLTAKKALDELPESTWYGSIVVLGVRSIENLLCAAWLKKTDTQFDSPHVISALELIEGSGEELCRFANLKRQSDLCEYRNHANAHLSTAFRPDVDTVSERVGCQGACGTPCLKFGSLKPCVMKVADFFEQRPTVAARALLDDSIHEQLGRQLFEFGIGAPIMRA